MGAAQGLRSRGPPSATECRDSCACLPPPCCPAATPCVHIQLCPAPMCISSCAVPCLPLQLCHSRCTPPAVPFPVCPSRCVLPPWPHPAVPFPACPSSCVMPCVHIQLCHVLRVPLQLCPAPVCPSSCAIPRVPLQLRTRLDPAVRCPSPPRPAATPPRAPPAQSAAVPACPARYDSSFFSPSLAAAATNQLRPAAGRATNRERRFAGRPPMGRGGRRERRRGVRCKAAVRGWRCLWSRRHGERRGGPGGESWARQDGARGRRAGCRPSPSPPSRSPAGLPSGRAAAGSGGREQPPLWGGPKNGKIKAKTARERGARFPPAAPRYPRCGRPLGSGAGGAARSAARSPGRTCRPSLFQSIMSYNGGAVMAMKGKNCVAIAADRRFGIQAQMVTTDFQKIFPMGGRLYIGLAGLATDVQTV